MKPVPLRELRLLGVAKRFQIHQPIQELSGSELVQGWVEVQHQGTELEVSGAGSTLVQLCCDRCLSSFSYRLNARCEELIAIRGGSGASQDQNLDGSLEGAVESVDPEGEFDPRQWLYEQLSLELPLKRLCKSDCEGILPIQSSEQQKPTVKIDPRWASLEDLSNTP
jgi:uncharacterized protein